MVAAGQGLEPQYHAPEACVLPLDEPAIFNFVPASSAGRRSVEAGTKILYHKTPIEIISIGVLNVCFMLCAYCCAHAVYLPFISKTIAAKQIARVFRLKRKLFYPRIATAATPISLKHTIYCYLSLFY